jgi:hypothetical protein
MPDNKNQDFSDHEIHLKYFRYEDIRDLMGKKTGCKSWDDFKTSKGIIHEEVWREQALELISKYGETGILENLKKFIPEYCAWLKTKDEILQYALELHMMRIFENPNWACYGAFHSGSEQLSLF